MKKICKFPTNKTYICLLCNDGKLLKGSMYNAKDHIAAAHEEIAAELGVLESYRARLSKRNRQRSKKNRSVTKALQFEIERFLKDQ